MLYYYCINCGEINDIEALQKEKSVFSYFFKCPKCNETEFEILDRG